MEGKKAFSLYIDLIQLVNGSNIHGIEIEPMTDEEAGMLFRWILEYVNDLHPAVPKEIKFAVVQVKKQLDDDLERYKEKCKKNKENIGKRWNTKENQNIPNDTNVYERIPSDTKNTDKDKDKDKDIYNNDLSISKDISKSSGEVSREKPTPLIILPCIGNYQHPIFKDDIDHYKELYPAVDILQQFKNMVGWLESNPQNRKTKNGVKSFITRWLSKCQDKAPKIEPKAEHQEYAENPPFRIAFESDEEYNQRLRAAGWQLKNGVPAKLNGGYEEL